MDSDQQLIRSINLVAADKYYQAGSTKIHYIVAGSGPPLLLLHGATIGWGQWYANIRELANHFTVYALDLPGSGRSSAVDFRTADLTELFIKPIEEFIKSKNLNPVSIIGHSIGGWIAMKLAIRIPSKIKRLILVDPIGFTDQIPWHQRIVGIYPVANLLSRTALKPTKKNMEKFLMSVLYGQPKISSDYVSYFHSNIRRTKTSHPILFINGMMSGLHMRPELVLTKDIPNIKCPVLLVAGINDPIVSIEQVKKAKQLLPTAQLVTFDKTGHIPPIEKSKEFNKLALDFLSATS